MQKIFAKESLNVPNVKVLSIPFFQPFWLIYAFLLRMKACTWHIEWFSRHQKPQQPQWPQWPQQPQWPQWPQQPHFIKTLTEHDVAINLATKWHILGSTMNLKPFQTPKFINSQPLLIYLPTLFCNSLIYLEHFKSC